MDPTATVATPSTGDSGRRPIAARIAGAPISWGVCEVPGWGFQLDHQRVLADMRSVGIQATEFGPDGFLPEDPTRCVAVLRDFGLTAVGGFVPVVLHDSEHDPLPQVNRAVDRFVASGAGVVVLAAVSGLDGYDRRPELDAWQWKTLLANLDRLNEHAAERGIVAALHPHMGTVVEQREEVDRVLEGSTIGLCLDTGHLLIGGTDPVVLARQATSRIAHTHLKDVNAEWADRVRTGEVSYTAAVAAGMYVPLGAGDVDIAAIVTDLDGQRYDGWFVMEQDTILDGNQTDEGPAAAVRKSVEFLNGLAQP